MAPIFRKQVSRQRATSSSAATAYDHIRQELTAQLSRLLTKSLGRSVPLGLQNNSCCQFREIGSARNKPSSHLQSPDSGRQPYSTV
jgi:hypothetical protein